MSRNVYLDAYGEACDRHFAHSLPTDLKAWGDMLKRHGRALRRPYASHRAAVVVEDDRDGDLTGLPPTTSHPDA